MEAPEHRVELVHAARRELVGVRTPLAGAEPHVPVNARVGRAFLRRVLGFVEEADRVGRAAELLAAAPVVRIHVLHVADETVAHDHHRRAELRPAALHRAGLEHAAVFRLRGNHLASLVHAEREGLFAVDVLAALHGLDGHVGVPVVGRGDAHHVDRRVFEDLAEVGLDAALRHVRDLPLGVRLVHHLRAGLAALLVAVAHGHDLDAELVLVHELRHERRALLDAEANEGHVGFLAGLERARTDLVGGAAGERRRGCRSEQEVPAVEVHLLYFLSEVLEINRAAKRHAPKPHKCSRNGRRPQAPCGHPFSRGRICVFPPCVLRLETTRTTGKNNFERGARANSPAHLSIYVCKNLDIIVSFLIGLWARAS